MNNPLLRNALVTFASFIFVITIVSAWTAPTGAPPTNNVSAPITISTTNQEKLGGLMVGSLVSLGGVKMGTSTAVCKSNPPEENTSGTVRWYKGAMEYCNGTAWVPFGGGGGGDNLGDHTATKNIDMNGSQVTDLGAPVNATDSATKGYVDGKCRWIQIWHTVNFATSLTPEPVGLCRFTLPAGSYCGGAFTRDFVFYGTIFHNQPTYWSCGILSQNGGFEASWKNSDGGYAMCTLTPSTDYARPFIEYLTCS